MNSLYESILSSTNSGRSEYINDIRKYIRLNGTLGKSVDASKIDYSEITFKQYLECATDIHFEFDIDNAYYFKHECRLNGHVDIYFKDGVLSINFTRQNDNLKRYDIFFVKDKQKQIMPIFGSQFHKEYENRITGTVASNKKVSNVAAKIKKLLELKYIDFTK